jgi:hypothetical protein
MSGLKLFFLAVATLMASIVHAGDAAHVAPESLSADLASVWTATAGTHPNPAHSLDAEAFAPALATLQQAIAVPMDRDAAWLAFARLNPGLADAHFFVGYPDWRGATREHVAGGGTLFPFEVVVDAEGRLLIAAALGGGAEPRAGQEIVAIDGVPAATVLAELLALAHGDTPRFRTGLVTRRWWFYYWKRFGTPTDYALALASGEVLHVPGAAALPKLIAEEEDFALQFRHEVREDGVALLKLGSFAWPDEAAFLAFTRQAFADFRRRGAHTLIIDVRDNEGGTDSLWLRGVLPYLADSRYRWGSSYVKKVLEADPARHERVGDLVAGEIDGWIDADPDNPLRFSGDVHVLVGEATYSSAVLFANTVQDFGIGRIAGPAGVVRSAQTGSVQARPLANTGLILWVPRFILTRPAGAGAAPFLTPDTLIETRGADPGAALAELLRQLR